MSTLVSLLHFNFPEIVPNFNDFVYKCRFIMSIIFCNAFYGFWIFYCAKRLRKQNLRTSRSFRIDLPHGIIYNWIAYHLRCDQRHVAHHPIDKGGFIP